MISSLLYNTMCGINTIELGVLYMLDKIRLAVLI